MSKQLPTDAITNELVNASVFFPKQQVQPTDSVGLAAPANLATPRKPVVTVETDTTKPKTEALSVPADPDTLLAQQQAVNPSSSHAAMQPRHHDTMPPNMMETIRKVVRQVGKEAATHRFTEEEKRKLADLVYTYERQGYRTSENEITRIAVNWLLWDYQEHGTDSVLARLLKALHE